MSEQAAKAAWRGRLISARSRMSATELAVAAEKVAEHLLGRLDGVGRLAAYVPVGQEPGSLDVLDRLASRGTVILLPVLRPNLELDWAVYEGRDALVTGRWGLRQPRAETSRPAGLDTVDAIVVPALAVDHAGTRLGRGSGYYDRALGGIRAGTPVVAPLHDGELVPRLPAEGWDRPMTAAVTPSKGWTYLPLVSHHGS